MVDDHVKVGELQGAYWWAPAGEVMQGVKAYQRAVTLRKTLYQRDPTDKARAIALIDAQIKLGDAYRKLNRTSDGIKVANAAVLLAETPGPWQILGGAIILTGVVLARRGSR